jgi:glycosyltransferase involved in cell wall biosynthesis
MTPTPIPFLVYGDGPRLPSGLARIARDLCARLSANSEALGIELLQFGVDPPDGWQWQGWNFYGFQPNEYDQGRVALDAILRSLVKQEAPRPIVLLIMDPGRCYDLTCTIEGQDPDKRPQFWGYFPIDSANVHDRISGPAAEALKACTRVLGYGRYGAQVLHATLSQGAVKRPVSYLPHGLEPVFHPDVPLSAAHEGFQEWRQALPPETVVLGCVATNQPRKDLSLLFASASLLRSRGLDVAVWLHTDRLTNAWDVGQLTLDFLLPRSRVLVSTIELQDPELAAQYCASTVTLAPGLGEGFGYPIVESLACGVPVVHVDFAGGVELIPETRWLVTPRAWRLEGMYAIKRPVVAPEDVASTLALVIDEVRQAPARMRAYCHGAVQHLQWGPLWPRWRSWIQRGLTQRRTMDQDA